MHPIKAISVVSFSLVVLFFQADASAWRMDAGSYRYPYKDPYVATATVTLMQGREELPSGNIRNLEIMVIEGRNDVYLLEGKGKLRYRFYQQEGKAPLIFIIPGLGSSAYVGSARYLAEFLARHGFHVLVLPSPFNWNFTLAASRSGFPGLIQEDAKDLYAAMRLTLSAVQKQWRAKIGKIGILGFSDGAREAAFISQLEAAQKKIGIDTYLLINPPVDLLNAIRQIDAMAAIGKSFEVEQRRYLEAYAFGVVTDALQNNPDDPDYFANWDRRIRLTDEQLAYLIGSELQKTVGDAIYASSLAYDHGILNTPVSWGYRSRRLNEARSYSLIEYLQSLLIPRIRQLSGQQMSIAKLNALTSLKGIKATLENNNIFLMHNLDDFLISDQGFAYLEQVFGDRAKFYPYGGHLGNLWFSENKQDMLDVFKPLLSDARQHDGPLRLSRIVE